MHISDIITRGLWEFSACVQLSRVEYHAKTDLVDCILFQMSTLQILVVFGKLEILLTTTPHVLLNTWGVVDSKNFH